MLVPCITTVASFYTEAALYFNIGQNRLRGILATNPDAEYLMTVGCKTLIKRRQFEDFLDSATAV